MEEDSIRNVHNTEVKILYLRSCQWFYAEILNEVIEGIHIAHLKERQQKMLDFLRQRLKTQSYEHCGGGERSGDARGLQIHCGALTLSRVGSIPMHPRHIVF